MEVKYNVLRKNLRTGDKVLFQGKGLISLIIRFLTWMKAWSHIGVIIRIQNNVFILESTSLKKGKKGVQIDYFTSVLERYKGIIAVRRVIGMKNNPHVVKVYKEIRDEMLGKDYEKKLLQLLGAALPWQNQRDLSSIFCSELVAEGDIRLGLLPESPASNEYTPNDYAEGGIVEKRMKIQTNRKVHLGDVIIVARNNRTM